MKRLIYCIGIFISIGFLASCAVSGHAVMRGTVAMKISNTQAHVCLGENEVKVGDTVSLYSNQCQHSQEICRKVYFANGKIIKTLNQHYSIVEFPTGTRFTEGDIVEKRQ